MRVRFAPSPTGDMHLGNARTAVLNWLLFKKDENNSFVLRIEDTDEDRNQENSESGIYNALSWLGLDWTEGPENPKDCGPYRQSESKEIYNKYIDMLLENGNAYYCYKTPEQLEVLREEKTAAKLPPIFRRDVLESTPEEIAEYEKNGVLPTIRFAVPDQTVAFDDLIKGNVSFETENITDFVIRRGNGTPTYNYAVVIDDMRMDISVVVRGDDHLANTPKQILLYEAIKALGEDISTPDFAHLPMILGPDKSKLSKRHGSVSVNKVREEGYLPEVVVNYLSLLGWSSGDEQEIFTKDELVKAVDLSRISKSAAVFDFDKLKWMNQQALKAYTDEEFINFVMPFLESTGWDLSDKERTEKVILTVRESVRYGKDIIRWTELFFQDIDPANFDDEMKEVLSWEESKIVITEYKTKLENMDEFVKENIQPAIKEVQKENKIKGKKLFMPLRVALTGAVHGPDLVDSVVLVGKDKSIALLERVIAEYFA